MEKIKDETTFFSAYYVEENLNFEYFNATKQPENDK